MYGLPIGLEITSGEVHDAKATFDWIAQVAIGAILIADTGYDSQAIRDSVESNGKATSIPRRKNPK